MRCRRYSTERSAHRLCPSGLSLSWRAQPHGEGCSARCGAEPCGERPPGTPWALLPATSELLDAEPDSPPLWPPQHHQPQRPLERRERSSKVLQSLPTSPARSRREPRTRSSCSRPSPARPGPRAPRIPAHHSPTAPSPARERSLVGSELLSSRSRGWKGPSWRSSRRLRPREGLNQGPTAPRSLVAAGLLAWHVVQRRSPQLLCGHRVQQPHLASGTPNNALLGAGKHR